MRNMTHTQRMQPTSETQGLKYLNDGLQPGDLVMLAWKEEKLIRP